MAIKTAGVGHFQIPTAPAAGVSVASGAANTYTTSAVQLIASTAAALFITGIYAEEAAVSAATYKSVQLMIGTAGSETVLGQYLIAPSTGSTVTRTFRPIYPPIPVAAGQRIAAKTADSVGALATLISLEVLAQSNYVDDGVPVGSVNSTSIGRGTVGAGSSTTSITTSAFSPAGAVANQFLGRVVVFDNTTTTAALRGVASTISASSNAATPTFTVGVLPATPASGDTFSVV